MIGVLIRVAVSAGLLGLLLWKVDLAELGAQLASMSPSWLALALAAQLTGIIAVGWRWRLVLAALEQAIALGAAVRNVAVGTFFNQTLPSSIGGDAIRMWEARRHGLPLRESVTSVIVDRLLGLAAVVVMLIAGQWFYFSVVPDPRMGWGLAAVTLAGMAGFVVLFLIARFVPEGFGGRIGGALVKLSLDARSLALHPVRSLQALAVAVALQVCFGAIVYCLGRAADAPLGLWQAVLLMPPVALFSMLPISIAGWGTREGAMVVALGLVGVGSADALAISLAYGVIALLAGLPGGILWLRAKRRGEIPAGPIEEPKI